MPQGGALDITSFATHGSLMPSTSTERSTQASLHRMNKRNRLVKQKPHISRENIQIQDTA